MSPLKTLALAAALTTACAKSPREVQALAAIDNPNCPPTESFSDQVVVATVGCLPITEAEWHAKAARTAQGADGLSNAQKRVIIDELIQEKLLVLRAVEQGVQWRPKVQKLMTSTLLREEVYATVRNSDFTDDELRAYFEEHMAAFTVPEKRQIYSLLVATNGERTVAEAKSQADALRAQLLADPSAAKGLAIANSDGPYRRRGGDMGFVSRAGKPGVPDVVVSTAFEQALNAISEPIKTDRGFYLVMVKTVRPEVSRTYEQMKGSVLRRVKNERYKSMLDDYVQTIRGDHRVQVDRSALTAPPPSAGGRTGFGGRGLDSER